MIEVERGELEVQPHNGFLTINMSSEDGRVRLIGLSIEDARELGEMLNSMANAAEMPKLPKTIELKPAGIG